MRVLLSTGNRSRPIFAGCRLNVVGHFINRVDISRAYTDYVYMYDLW